MDGWMDGWMDGQTHRQTHRHTDRHTDRQTHTDRNRHKMRDILIHACVWIANKKVKTELGVNYYID